MTVMAKVVFDGEKIGRTGGKPATPLELKTQLPTFDGQSIDDLTDAHRVDFDRAAYEIELYARRFLASSDVGVGIIEVEGLDGADKTRGVIYAGMRTVGKFTIEP